MTTELIEVKPVITGSLPMMPQQSGSVEIRASKSVETKVPLRYMEYMLYFLVFMILMFNTPFFIFVPIWIKNEFENGDRRQYWGDVTQETMLLIILIIGSLDFLQPLLTPYIKNHIRLQCKVSFIAGVIANFLFLCASFKAVSGPLVSPVMMSVIAAIFTGICNCSHLFEYFIREMTKDKKRQSEIIENVAICQILGIIVVTAICSTTHDFGEENDKQGFAYLNGVSLAFGIIGTGVLYYFIQCLPPKPYYPPLSAGPACSLKNMWNTAFKGLPGPVCVILAVRFVISFNFGMFRVIISPNFDNMLDAMPNMRKNKTVIMGAMFCIAIVISMSFLYLMRDTFHRNKWIWFPYIQLCISGTAPWILIALAFAKNFWVLWCLGILGASLSTLMQAKLTIDRNIMSTDEILPKTSNLSLIVNGIATCIAMGIAPHLNASIGMKALTINAGNLFLVFCMLLWFHLHNSLKGQLARFQNVEVKFQNSFLNFLHDSWMRDDRISQVGKARLLEELKKHETDISMSRAKQGSTQL